MTNIIARKMTILYQATLLVAAVVGDLLVKAHDGICQFGSDRFEVQLWRCTESSEVYRAFRAQQSFMKWVNR
jgi:hypothetical protein